MNKLFARFFPRLRDSQTDLLEDHDHSSRQLPLDDRIIIGICLAVLLIGLWLWGG